MKLNRSIINSGLSKEQAILYYLFIDDQLLCAWWDYLEIWDEIKEEQIAENSEFREKMRQTMAAVDYWEDILDQLKKIITYEDIEDYIKENPHITKSYLFVR